MIVGCGIVGLVVAMQLSEITNAYVLCIEAGTL
jgi:L-2-hydroxyglutarate oxidase LhgO